MTETELKRFTISLIKSKEKENEDYIRYSYYELKVKDNLSEGEIDEVLRISRDYFENKGYKVYFTNAEESETTVKNGKNYCPLQWLRLGCSAKLW